MVRSSGVIKWEKSVQCRPVHNIISSDFPKYNPHPWKFMEGKSNVNLLMSYEYQRMWMAERDAWKKRMYSDNVVTNVDIIKRYVLSFKNDIKPPKPEKKKAFRMKKFQGIPSKESNKRASDDKAMAFNKIKERKS